MDSGQHESLRNGYASLGSWVARDKDGEGFIFRRFDHLSARRLLHMQAELVSLEKELAEYDGECWRGDDRDLQQSNRRWETFVANAADASRNQERERMELMERLDGALDAYYQALVLQQQVLQLERPREQVIRAFRLRLHGEKGDDPVIGGAAQNMYDEDDIVALKTPSDRDILSRTLQNHWPSSTRSQRVTDRRHGVACFREADSKRVATAISVVAATMLMVGAIISLYFVTRPGLQLGLVAVFTVLFSLSLGVLTNARTAEMFGATAAYAAVLVVFVSGNLGNNKLTT